MCMSFIPQNGVLYKYSNQQARASSMTAQTETSATVRQTAANNPVLARIKAVANSKVYSQVAIGCNAYGEEWAANDAAIELFGFPVQGRWKKYFLTGKIGGLSISADTAATWGITQ